MNHRLKFNPASDPSDSCECWSTSMHRKIFYISILGFNHINWVKSFKHCAHVSPKITCCEQLCRLKIKADISNPWDLSSEIGVPMVQKRDIPLAAKTGSAVTEKIDIGTLYSQLWYECILTLMNVYDLGRVNTIVPQSGLSLQRKKINDKS